jgi:hypothetical protein
MPPPLPRRLSNLILISCQDLGLPKDQIFYEFIFQIYRFSFI